MIIVKPNDTTSNALDVLADKYKTRICFNEKGEISSLRTTGEKGIVFYVFYQKMFGKKCFNTIVYNHNQNRVQLSGFLDNTFSLKPASTCVGKSLCHIDKVPVFELDFHSKLSITTYEAGKPAAIIHPDGSISVAQDHGKNVKLGPGVIRHEEPITLSPPNKKAACATI